jgi:WD40 repeat protein
MSLLTLAWLLCAPSEAATYDPELTWRTLSTEHFDIHFHQGIEQVADEFSTVVEDIYATMTEELAWQPRPRIQVTLIDRTDDANGFASAVPFPQITIYVTAPGEDSTLQLYERWDEAIMTHELTHVLHLDTNGGIVRAARLVVGRIASTNGLSPAWMIEGLATFEETRHTAGGRGRASWPDMMKRTAVLQDDFPPLGNLDGFQPKPPTGNLRYLWGQDFIQYVSDHRGRDVWTRWTHTYGSWIPFWLPSDRAFGRSLRGMYADWKVDSYERYQAQASQVRQEGETRGRLVSNPEASCVAPAFSPDGTKLVWSCYDLRTGSQIWLADGEGYAPELLLENNGAGYFTWRGDSQAFVFAANHLVNQFNVWSDIYLYTLGGSAVALTNGARARDPDFSPDGSSLLYVTNKAQNNQLEKMTVDRRRQPLTAHTDHTQYSTPRFSPDGRWLALSVWQDGLRDLWIYDSSGQPARRVTMDPAIEADPTWSPDGRWLLFSSDRSGIPNIYAIELETERLWQVTNVTTGAVRPSLHPDSPRMAYMQYSADGWDVHILDLDEERYLDRGLLPRPLRHDAPMSRFVSQGRPEAVAADWAPPAEAPAQRALLRPVDPFVVGADPTQLPVARQTEVLDNFGDVVVEDAFGEESEYPFQIEPHRYNPTSSLLPRYVLPVLQTTPYRPRPDLDFSCLDPQLFCPALQVSLSTGATDVLRRYGWGASVSYRTDAQYLGAAAAVTLNRFLPVYSLGASTFAVSPTALYVVDLEAPFDENGELVPQAVDYYWEKRSSVFAVVSWPYRLRSTLFAQYSFQDRRPRFALPGNVYEPALPFIGYVGALSGGWRFVWSEPTSYAISAEDGEVLSLVGSLRAPWLGSFSRDLATGELSPLTQLQLTSEVRKYWTNPWLDNHVLATRAAAGVTLGANQFFGNYLLGGSIGDTGLAVTPDEFRMVRGYPFGTDVGDLYWLASLEYRLPLLRFERGLGTIPLYARTLSASAFIDTANAFVSPSFETGVPPTAADLWAAAIEEPLMGVGGELILNTVVAYGIGLSARFGYGVGLLGPAALRPADTDGDGATTLPEVLAPAYLQLGGSF